MSDKVELIAAAQLNVVSGSPGSIDFKSRTGFESASRGSPGSYEVTLSHEQDARKLVISATLNNTVGGTIVVAPERTGDVRKLQVTCCDANGALVDSSFYIKVEKICS